VLIHGSPLNDDMREKQATLRSDLRNVMGQAGSAQRRIGWLLHHGIAAFLAAAANALGRHLFPRGHDPHATTSGPPK
jgi:hypothetical protein